MMAMMEVMVMLIVTVTKMVAVAIMVYLITNFVLVDTMTYN